MAIQLSNTVSAVQARKQFGKLLDKAFYRNESFIVERSGEPRAVIVPLQAYQEMKRKKQEAKARLFSMIDEISARNKDVDSEEIQVAIDEAVAEVRAEYSNK